MSIYFRKKFMIIFKSSKTERENYDSSQGSLNYGTEPANITVTLSLHYMQK